MKVRKLLFLVSSILLLTACSGENSEKQVIFTHPEYDVEFKYTPIDGHVTKFYQYFDYSENAESVQMSQEEFEKIYEEDDSIEETHYYSFDVADNFILVETFDLLEMTQEEYDTLFGDTFGSLTDKGIKEEDFILSLEENGFERK